MKKCLALAPDEVVAKILHATTYLASNVEDDNRDTMKRHYKARFLFLN